MRHFVASLLLVLSLLLSWGTQAFSQESPASPPRQTIQQAPYQAQLVEEIRDIKGPVPVSDTPRFLIPAIAAVALLVIAGLLYIFLKRRNRKKVVATMPDVTALTELDRARSLMNKPLVYAERISAILRQYIESRFQIRSTRQTTQEFFSRLKKGATIAEVDIKSHAEELQECMEQCDIAKFAHATPNQERMVGMDQAIRNFIETTRPKESP